MVAVHLLCGIRASPDGGYGKPPMRGGRAIVARAVSLSRIMCLTAAIAVVVAGGAALATARPGATPAAAKPDGRQLYRQFCGQCHSLAAARAVGFGSSKGSGLGKLGGPSFNEMRVPYAISVRHVTQPTGGHEAVGRKITPKQLHTVAAYIAKVTREHPIPALPTDG